MSGATQNGWYAYVAKAPTPMDVGRFFDDDRLTASADDPAALGTANRPVETTESPRHGCDEGSSVSNPWLKKNPFMSMWLSGANSVAASARGRIAGEAKRQSKIAVNKAAGDMISIWTNALVGPRASKRKKRR